MLDYFAEKGWIELEVSGMVHGYRKLEALPDAEQLTQELYQYMLDREIGELTRIDEVYTLMCSDRCQSAAISEHIGQPMHDACGHCSVCDGKIIGALPDPELAESAIQL